MHNRSPASRRIASRWLVLASVALGVDACASTQTMGDAGDVADAPDVARADGADALPLDGSDPDADFMDDAPDPIDDLNESFDVMDDAPTDGSVDAGADSGPPPVPLATPIRYLVIITKENHTFDNMFFNFPGVASPPPARATTSTGGTVALAGATLDFHYLHQIGHPNVGIDPSHAHSSALDSYHGGRMDRFDQGGNIGNVPFYHYPESQIRNYWAYARNFVLADNYFSTFLGPSLPGHLVAAAGYSPVMGNAACPDGVTCPADMCDPTTRARVQTFNGLTCNVAATTVRPCFNVPIVTDNLPAGITWRTYGNVPMRYFRSIHDNNSFTPHWHSALNLIADLRRGDMANVTFLNGGFGGPSEHPPEHPCLGENHTVEVINAIIDGGHWDETAIVFSYDDWGGWYDHVRPPVTACGSAAQGPFNPGFRLPLMIISPYARRGTSTPNLVFHTRTEQASVARLVAELMRSPGHAPVFLHTRNPQSRDEGAGSLLGAFDFTQTPRPPLRLTPRTDCPASPP